MSDVYDTDTSSLSSSEYTDSDTSSVSSLESEISSVQIQRPSKYNGIYRALLVLRYICYVMWLIMFVIDFSRNGSMRKRHQNANGDLDETKYTDYVQTMFNDCFLSPGTHLFWLLSVVVYFMTNKMKVSRTETLSVELLSFLCLFILVPSRRTQGIRFWTEFGNQMNSMTVDESNKRKTNKVVQFIQKHENLSTQNLDNVQPKYKKPVVRIIQELSPPRPDDSSIIKTDPVERSETLFDSLKNFFSSGKKSADATTA